jgi:hypothetical protein
MTTYGLNADGVVPESLTAQEVFDTVARHLLRQNVKALDDDGRCRYRTGDTACAVGCLMTDEEVDGLVGESVIALYDRGRLPRRLWQHVWLLQTLQGVHDCRYVAEWRDRLRALAESHGLDMRVDQ